MKKQTRDDEIEFIFEAPFPTPEFMSHKLKVLALPDGKRYLADGESSGSTIFVARVDHNGVPDEGFGPSGWRAEHLSMSGSVSPAGLLLREDGRVIAALSNEPGLGLVCFRADGTLDPAFGQNGKVVHSVRRSQGGAEGDQITDSGDESQRQPRATGSLGGIVPGEDGKFFGLVGRRFGPGSVLVRCTPDGQLDPEFNGNGIVTVSHPTLALPANAGGIVSTSDGGVVVAGTLGANQLDMRTFFCRYNRDGSLDEQFGDKGFAVFNSETAGIPLPNLSQMELNHITYLADEGFAACGNLITKPSPAQQYGLVICVDSLGMPIESFNSGKPLLFGLLDSAETDFLFGGIAEQADGKIVAGGGVNDRSAGYARDMLVVRFRQDGGTDPSFGGQGWVRVRPLDSLINYMTHLVLDSDGKILVAGSGGPTNGIASHRSVVLQFD